VTILGATSAIGDETNGEGTCDGYERRKYLEGHTRTPTIRFFPGLGE